MSGIIKFLRFVKVLRTMQKYHIVDFYRWASSSFYAPHFVLMKWYVNAMKFKHTS